MVVPIGGMLIKPTHPRVLLNEPKLEELRRNVRDVSVFRTLYEGTFYPAAEQTLDRPPVRYEKVGRRMLPVIQTCAARVFLLSLVYLISHERRFFVRAEAELLAAAEFPDWNPDHYLDVGEMTAAVGIGLDWLYPDLSEATRETLTEAIYWKGLRTTILEDGSRRPVMFSNWIQICYGGLSLGAMAIAERDPELTEEILSSAKTRATELVKSWYSPNGAYAEGPTYWDYGTSYHVLLIDALVSAFGTDFETASVPGFKESSVYRVAACAPTGQFFNYSDCDADPITHPIQFWFASHYRMPGVVSEADLRAVADTYEPDGWPTRFAPLVLLWLDPAMVGGNLPDETLNFVSDGMIPVGMFRSAWNDPDALFLGTVGGKGNLPHGHLDAGTWVLDWEGVRWAMELGRVDYHFLESQDINIWDTRAGSARWTVFHYGNHGHNTLTANGAFHDASGVCKITDFTVDAASRRMSVDLTPCFPDTMTEVTRTFEIQGDDAVVITDTWKGTVALTSLRWRMFTPTRVEINGSKAALTADGKQLTMEILTPPGATFTTRPAAELLGDFDAPLPGVQVIDIDLAVQSGTLEVSLTRPVPVGPA